MTAARVKQRQPTKHRGAWGRSIWLLPLLLAVGVWLAGRPRRDTATAQGPFQPTVAGSQASAQSPPGMVWVPGGEFSMGCSDPRGVPFGGTDPMRDARPVHRVGVDGFWMDVHEVTNDQFAEFVKATGYVTVAERPPRAEDFPGALPENLVAGSIVFTPPAADVPLRDATGTAHLRWWAYVPGAYWKHPEGPDSDLAGKGDQPVVHVAFEDAEAYAAWAGKRLPHGGGMGVCIAWGACRCDLSVGQRVQARRPLDGQHLAGAISGREHRRRWFPEHRTGGPLPCQRLRTPRHVGERLGMVQRLVSPGYVCRGCRGGRRAQPARTDRQP